MKFFLFFLLFCSTSLLGNEIKLVSNYEHFEGKMDFRQDIYSSKLDYTIDTGEKDKQIFSAKADYYQSEGTKKEYLPENLYGVHFSVKGKIGSFYYFSLFISNSNKPYHSSEESNFFGGIFYSVEPYQNHQINLGFVYYTEPVIQGIPQMPIPFVEYRFVSNPVRIFLGIESGIQLSFSENISFKLQIPLISGDYWASIRMNLGEGYYLNAFYKTTNKDFLVADRSNKDLYLKKRGNAIGIELNKIFSRLEYFVWGGYSFNNTLFYQEFVPLGGSRKKYNEKKLASGMIFSLGLKIFF